MPKSGTKRWMAAAAAVVAISGLGVLVPESAYAATPVCASWSITQGDNVYEWHTPTSGSGNQNRACSLKQGNTGWGVVVLQEALRACFGQNISADGQFGPLTKNALRNAQSQINSRYGAGIAVDGEYGPQTASWWWDAKYYRTGGVVYGGFSVCAVHLGSL